VCIIFVANGLTGVQNSFTVKLAAVLCFQGTWINLENESYGYGFSHTNTLFTFWRLRLLIYFHNLKKNWPGYS